MLQVFPSKESLERDLQRLLKTYDKDELGCAIEMAYLPFPPRRFNIGITSQCNYNCPFCFNHASKKYDYVRPMTVDTGLLYALIKKIRGVEVLAFEVMGESLLHPQCLDLMEYATRYVHKIALTTNGSLLTKKVADRLLHLPMDEIFFSCDASDRETYERMRVNGSFSNFQKNVNYLSGKTDFKLNFNAIVFSMNMESLLGLPRLASDLGVQRIQFVPQNVTKQALSMGFQPSTLKQLREFLPQVIEQCDKYDVAYQFVWSLIPPELSDSVPSIDFTELCMMPFDSMTIDPFGRTNFCCYLEWFEDVNAFGTDPEDLWNCREARLLRAFNLIGLFPEACHQYCHRKDYYRKNWKELRQSISKTHHVNWREIRIEEFLDEAGSFVLWPAGKITRKLLKTEAFGGNQGTCRLIGIIDRKAKELGSIQDIPVFFSNGILDMKPDSIVITSDTFTKEILAEALRMNHPCRIFHMNERGELFAWQDPSHRQCIRMKTNA